MNARVKSDKSLELQPITQYRLLKNRSLVTVLYVFAVSTLFLGVCAHHRDLRPGANGTPRVVIQTKDKAAGARDAIDHANHFCKE